MHHLNNKGWGLAMMLFLMSILLIFLGIAIFFIYRFYNTIETEDLSATALSIIKSLI